MARDASIRMLQFWGMKSTGGTQCTNQATLNVLNLCLLKVLMDLRYLRISASKYFRSDETAMHNKINR